ncbi:MAG: N-acyl homoserine lactonase family protein, partial [Desulfurococcales archaeon]|nr:N-acyl homoserine lactonase family protein [Desulfurococcales archaeon]
LLDYGWLAGDGGWFLPGWGAATYSEREPRRVWVEIPVSGVLLDTDIGYILFDTGVAPDAWETHTRPVLEAFPIIKFGDENRLENQLKAVGLKPEDVAYVIQSHLHFDHVGQTYLFKDHKTPIIVHKKELQFALMMLWMGKEGAYQSANLEPLKGANWFIFDGNFFELAEGIRIYFSGGHTPGHVVLSVKTKKGNVYFFTGDHIHLPRELEVESKGWLLADYDEWLTFVKQLKLWERAQKAKIVICHDPDLWKKYPKAPNYME